MTNCPLDERAKTPAEKSVRPCVLCPHPSASRSPRSTPILHLPQHLRTHLYMQCGPWSSGLGLRHLAMSFCLSLCHFPGESFPAVRGETRLPLVGPVPLLTHTQNKMICSMTFPPDHMGSLRVGPTLLIKA